MKKQYVAPVSETITLMAESMLASSPTIGIDPNTEVDANTSYSNKRGWSSEQWSDSEAE